MPNSEAIVCTRNTKFDSSSRITSNRRIVRWRATYSRPSRRKNRHFTRRKRTRQSRLETREFASSTFQVASRNSSLSQIYTGEEKTAKQERMTAGGDHERTVLNESRRELLKMGKARGVGCLLLASLSIDVLLATLASLSHSWHQQAVRERNREISISCRFTVIVACPASQLHFLSIKLP